MQTYSVILSTQINFEYDATEMKHASAFRQAIRNAISPMLQENKGVKVVGVQVTDPECGSIIRRWGRN